MNNHFGEVQESLRTALSPWLVNGGAGFIGSHQVARLLGLGQQAVVLDNLSAGHLANLVPAAWYLGEPAILGGEG